MIYTREMIIAMLAERCNFQKKQIRELLHEFDDLILDLCEQVEDDEEVDIQLLRGLKVGCRVVPQRERVDPRTYQPIICGETVKPHAKWSNDFKDKIQKRYEGKKSDGK